MKLFVKIQSDEEKKWYPMECNFCGWVASSEFADGGSPIADTGDYTDPQCPCCGSKDVDECDNDQPLVGYIERLNKALAVVKSLTERLDKEHWDKQSHEAVIRENAMLHKQVDGLKHNQQFG